jgi:hypothetical protein
MEENLNKWKEVKTQEKDQQGEYWKPQTIGDSLTGKVIARVQGEYGLQYKIKTEGGIIFITPSHRVLQAKLENVTLGTDVKITLDGELPAKVEGRSPTKMYSVFLKE